MTNYSAQKIACAAASAAALATATAAIYYVYRKRQLDTEKNSEQSRSHTLTTEQPQPNPLESSVQPSSLQHSHSPASQDRIQAEQQSQPIETSSQSSREVPLCPQTQVPSNVTSTDEITATNSFAWAVFWDIENVPVPRTISPTHFVQALRKTLAAHRRRTHPDSILRIHAITNVRRASVQLRNHLQANGVNVTHVESKGRKDAADKALITEICLITREHPTPFGICLISGDGDFSYPLSRLTALGYCTVVIAPMRQSFSTLLEAVPEAVIPLRSLLNGYEDLSIEPEAPLREAPLVRRPDQQTMRHPMPVVPLLTPVHIPRRPDKGLTRRRRRERILPPGAPTEREGNPCRPWSSDDDRSAVRMSHSRMSRRPPQSYALTPYIDHDSQIPASQVHRAQVAASNEDSPVSPPRVMPLPNEQIQMQGETRQWGDHLGLEPGRQDDHEPRDRPASRAKNGSVSRTVPTRNTDVKSTRASHSNIEDRRRMANGPRVRFARDTIISENEEREPPREDTPQGNRKGRTRLESSGRQNNRVGQAPTSSADSRQSSEVPVQRAAVAMRRWFYSGTRAMPFVAILIVVGFSLLFSSLRVAIAVLEALQKV